ncbi:hypothetical protein [Methylotenera mobilis]|uniref:PilZ domain-containing protein n=1 Tax=Methylotenera mobilis (strain JLW8 / ATCC BAA-1282 / DSM 17540) TaxID=583345 RepID=C6WYK9_METML|nr:hypothetical protein [Methylotenera mobilis]ACT48928.1 conserved hypothetical protein [Methylotenera mobilis JLW8]
MALNLNIPTLQENPVFIAETRPQKIQQLLQEINSQDPADIATHLHNELETLNRQKASSSQRTQALDYYRSLIISVTTALAADYVNSTLPLEDKAKSAAAACEALWLELGYGYKLVLIDLQNQLIKLRTDKSSALAIQRAMHAIAEYTLVHYQTYLTPPSHVWSDLHQLYFCAAKLGILHTNTPADTTPTQAKNYAQLLTSIEDTYKHTLLVSLAQPHHLLQQDISAVADYLAHHIQAARVTAIEPLENSSGAFIINLTSDAPPTPYGKLKSAPNPDSELLLHTIDLIRGIHEDLGKLQNRSIPVSGSINADANHNDYIELLSYLITNWGIAPKRIFNRSAKNGDIDIAVGIEDIHSIITAANSDPVAQVYQATPSHWKILNISATGISIRRYHTAQKNIKVGSLIALKARNEQQWSIGLVKWANCGTRDRLDIGVQLIAPYADSAFAQTFQHSSNTKVLKLPEISAVNQAATIIAPRGTYIQGRQLTFTCNKKTVQASLERLIERTHDIERIQFNIMN